MNVREFLLQSQHAHSLFNVIAVIAEGLALPAEGFVIDNDHTAFAASCEVFALAEAVASNVAHQADLGALVLAADALCTVLNDLEVVLLGNFQDGPHVGYYAVQVNHNDAFGAGVMSFLMDSGSIVWSSVTSAKTGIAPACTTAKEEAIKV